MMDRQEVFGTIYRKIAEGADEKPEITPEFILQSAILETLLDIRDLLDEWKIRVTICFYTTISTRLIYSKRRKR